MTHIIKSLCLRDNGCMDVCPVECINPGTSTEQWPTYYIDEVLMEIRDIPLIEPGRLFEDNRPGYLL